MLASIPRRNQLALGRNLDRELDLGVEPPMTPRLRGRRVVATGNQLA